MIKTLQFLLKSQLQRSRVVSSVDGFTLIELLVAMILAVIVIAPLMGFMINVMDTDRREEAKTISEQEIQTALDYIARDLQQAIYIYDNKGIDAIKDQLPNKDSTDRVPVLVFWKRELVNQALTVGSEKDDTFIYSLVAYYLVKDTSTTWSKAARITRWQIRDGIASNIGVICTGYTGNYVSTDYCPSSGFAPFNLDGVGSLEDKMNSWVRLSSYTTKNASNQDVVNTVNYTDTPIVLVDYIDQTITGAPAKISCPTGSTLVAPDKTSFNTRDTSKMTSFYACIDRVNTTAQVFLRGNALARLQNNNIDYTAIQKTYYPSVNIRVQGRSYLFTK